MEGQVGTIDGTEAPDCSPLAVYIVFSGNSCFPLLESIDNGNCVMLAPNIWRLVY